MQLECTHAFASPRTQRIGSSFVELALGAEECRPVILGDFPLPAGTMLNFDGWVLPCLLGRLHLADYAAVGLLLIDPHVTDLDILGCHLAAGFADNILDANQEALLAAIAAFLAAVPPLLMGDPVRAARARNRLVAALAVHEPHKTLLGRNVLVHFLDGVFFGLRRHASVLQKGLDRLRVGTTTLG